MENLRFAAAIAVLFVAAFLGGRWFLKPQPAQPEAQAQIIPDIQRSGSQHVPLRPDARLPTFQRIDLNNPQHRERQRRESSFESDNDSVRDGLRQAVLSTANQLSREPCDQAAKVRYIEAAVKYTRARLSIAPCVATYTCSGADEARLDRAGEAFGTPLDRRVWEAMGQAHETDALRSSDFPKDVVGLVAETARDPVLNPRTEARFKATRTPLTCGSASRQ